MAASLENKNRRVVPRWRTFRTAASLGELEGHGPSSNIFRPREDFLFDKIKDWKSHKTAWHASDLLSAALVLGRNAEATEAARFLVRANSGATSSARSVARKVLLPNEVTEEESSFQFDTNQRDIYDRIRVLKSRCREYPRNPISWVDIALAYSIIGEVEKASRAIDIALNLNSANRFILRSASRFFLHIGDFDRALWLFKNLGASSHDPWLVAAQIATASAAGKTARSLRRAKQIIRDDAFSPKHISELASAVATVEFENGNYAAARRFFRKALISPTENSIAQAEWTSTHMSGLDVEVSSFNVPRLFEAMAWEGYAKGDWEYSLKSSQLWYGDEPFSSRPAMLASYLASTIFEKHEHAERILSRSLIAEPAEPTLLNNLAFSYACQGRVDEAERTLRQIRPSSSPVLTQIALVATYGLVRFKQGRLDEARTLYLEAIERARSLSLRTLSAMAAIYLAQEELRVATPQATAALHRAYSEAKGVKDRVVLALLNRLKTLEKHRKFSG